MARPETATLTVSEARQGLRHALAQGSAEHAWHLAQGLIRADPRDQAAQVGLTIAALRLGRTEEAAKAAEEAWRLARTGRERYEAAMLMAQTTEAEAGVASRGRAALWVRRAVDHAPAEAHRNAALGEFQRLRTASRLQLRLEMALAPSSNVNNGTRQTTVEFLGQPFEISAQNQALSGWVAQSGISGRYRLAQNDDAVTALRFAALHREAWLSAQSRAALEQWRLDQLALGNIVIPRTDYSNSSVEFGLQHRRKLGQAILDLGAGVSHNWSGGQPFSRTLRFDLGVEVPQGRNAALFGALGAERQWRADGAQYDADILTLQAGMTNRLANGDTLRLGFGARRSLALSRDVAHEAVSARLAWQKARPLAGVRVSASLGVEHRRHAASVLTPGGRRDTRLDATLSLGFDGLARMGFAPTLDIHTSRNRSNNVFHDGRQIGLTLGFRSVF